MDKVENKNEYIEKIGQDQFYSFVFNEEISWQEIIYDLINSEQLDPWDIDLSLLAQKYLNKVRELEEDNFILSSKVLLVCSMLLRIKSEILLNYYIKNLDDILFKREQERQQTLYIKEIYDEKVPELMPKSPLPRFKKISLNELMSALNKAIETENRRIIKKRVEKETYERAKFFIPKKTISITQRVRMIHEKIKNLFQKQEKIAFSQFAGHKRQDKIDHLVPLLHLDNQNKLWLQQHKHFDEIWIHKNGDKFIERDEIITSKIEEQFENVINAERKVSSLK